MKITLLVLAAAGLFTGCSTFQRSPDPLAGLPPSDTYPNKADPARARAYGLGRLQAQRPDQAIEPFSRAANTTTATREWERENLTNAAMAALLAGQVEKARRQVRAAQRISAEAPPSDRLAWLTALLLDPKTPLPQPLRASIPKEEAHANDKSRSSFEKE